MKASSIRLHLSAIKHKHRVRNFNDPTASYRVNLALRGVSRLHPPLPDKRLAVSSAIFRKLRMKIVTVVDSGYEALLFCSALFLLYEGWFRIGELFAPSKLKAHESRFQYGNFICPDTGKLVVILSSDKTSFGRKRKLSWLPSSDARKILRRYLLRRPAPSSSAFFVHQDGSPLTVGQFRAIFRRLVIKANLNPSLCMCTPHSFRIGGCSRALAAGRDEAQILRHGRWSKQMLPRYSRPLSGRDFD